MKGIELPEKTEDFSADPVELFFDLAYVLAFSQLVSLLVHHPTWAEAGKAALLFWLMWLPWSQFTWSANAVSGNGRRVRLIFLAGTAASVPMAASVTTAFGDGGPVFAISLAVIYALAAATMALGLEKGSAVGRSLARFAGLTGVGTFVLVAGSFLAGDARIAAWLVAVAIIVAALVRAGDGTWIVRVGHFAERHALIYIIALGEVIVAIGNPVIEGLQDGEGIPGATLGALAASAVFAGLLWWAYFDRVGPSLEHRAGQLDDSARSRYVRDVYTVGHSIIVGGVILAATGLEEIALHPDLSVPVAFRVMLAGGLALGVGGVSLGVWIAYRAVAKERIVAGVVLVALVMLAGSASGLVLLVAVDVILAATLYVEHRRIEG